MAINRFSQGPIAANIQSNFIPLPVDAIGRQIERKQNQYDTTKAYINSMQDEMLKIKALNPDTETLKGIQRGYEENIRKELEGLNGDYSRAGGIAEQVARQLKTDYAQGQLGQINSNYLKAAEHMAKLDKLREAGLGDRGYNLGLRSISDFQGTREVAPGKYSSIDLYTPVKEVGIPEASQKYAKASADQYLATGQRYLNANEVAKNTYNNLVRDETIMSNAREEVRSQHGRLNPVKEDALTKEYLWRMAGNSGHERAFLEQFKPDTSGRGSGIDINGNPIVVAYADEGANPTKTGISKRVDIINSSISSKTEQDIIDAADINPFSDGGGLRGAQAIVDIKRARDAEKNKPVKLAESVKSDPVIMDRLRLMGVDLDNIDPVKLKSALATIQVIDESSRNTKYNIAQTDDVVAEFKAKTSPRYLLKGNIVDENNVPVPKEKRLALIEGNEASKGDSKYVPITYGGAVMAYGQPKPKGTIAAQAGGETIFILPYEVNSREHIDDRLAYVFSADPGAGGYTEYQNGKYKEIIQKVIDPTNPNDVAARVYKMDAQGNTEGTSTYYKINTGSDKAETPFKKFEAVSKKQNSGAGAEW
jgi:hypothetical protein